VKTKLVMSAKNESAQPELAGAVRMLRVEFKGQPYDWFNLEEMGTLLRTEDFAHTLRENINHYFNVPFDNQAVFDEDGLLVAPVDFARSLQHPRPYFRVYDTREMPQDLKDQTSARLSSLAYEVTKAQRSFGSHDVQMNGTNSGSDVAAQAAGGLPVSPWPVRDYQPSSSLADRLSAHGSASSVTVTQSQPYGSSQSIPPRNVGPSSVQAVPPRDTNGTLGTPRAQGGYQPAPCGQAAPQQSYSSLRTYDVGGTMDVTLSKDHSSGRAERFGFANVPAPDGRSLQISWIDGNGLLAMWNQAHPDKQVREGDVILSVNSRSENLEAMRSQLQADTIRLSIKSGGARPGTASGQSMGGAGSGQLQTGMTAMAGLQAMQRNPMSSNVPGSLQGGAGGAGSAMMNNLGINSMGNGLGRR